jgi:hypothetical protein
VTSSRLEQCLVHPCALFLSLFSSLVTSITEKLKDRNPISGP